MATLASQQVKRLGSGLTPAYVAATVSGDDFVPDRFTFLHVKNGAGSSMTVTVITQPTDALGNIIADNIITVPATAEKFIGPFPYTTYADAATGLASITYSSVTTVTIGCFQLIQP